MMDRWLFSQAGHQSLHSLHHTIPLVMFELKFERLIARYIISKAVHHSP